MSQSGYTPILVYASGTATNVPLAANMTSSSSGAELALNYTDGKLYYKNNSGVVTLLASSAANAPVLTFSAGTTGFTPSSATSGAITLAGTLAVTNGGTGLTTLTANNVILGAGTSTPTFVAPSTSGNILTSNGTTWTSAAAPAAGATLSNDTTTATNVYPIFAAATSGLPTTIYTSNAKYLYKPSTGELQALALLASNGLVVNNMSVGVSYTIPVGYSASSTGPITVASGIAVTIPSGSRWVVL